MSITAADVLLEEVSREADTRTGEILVLLVSPNCEYGRLKAVIGELNQNDLIEANVANDLQWELQHHLPCGVCLQCRLSKLS